MKRQLAELGDADDADDAALAAGRGNEEAFAELFHRYHARVWRAVYVRLGNRADADDAAADTFVRLHRALRRYRPISGSSFDAFIFRLADRAAIDVHRRRRKHGSDPLPDDAVAQGDEQMAGLDPALRHAFLALSAEDRETLYLRVLEGFSAADVGKMTGRSAGAVRIAQHRALTRLRARLEHHGP